MNREQRRKLARDISKQAARGAVDLSQLAQHEGEPPVLFMAYAAGDEVKTLWHESMMQLGVVGSRYGYAIRPRWIESGPQLDAARSLAAAAFFQTDDPYLLFVDTDIVFAPQDVAKLLEADAPIAGALYFTAAAGLEPWPVARVEGDDGAYAPVSLPEPPEDLNEENIAELTAWVEEAGKPMPVAAVGCGLMLIKREVLIDVASAYDGRPFEYVDGNSEDVTFCLRAAELGHETVLVPAARVGHVKATVL